MSFALPPVTGQILRAIREDLTLSPGQLAKLIGVSEPHYLTMERGGSPIRPLLDNAIRWVEWTRGEVAHRACPVCDGVGSYRRPDSPSRPGGYAPRIRCDACDGAALARQCVAA